MITIAYAKTYKLVGNITKTTAYYLLDGVANNRPHMYSSNKYHRRICSRKILKLFVPDIRNLKRPIVSKYFKYYFRIARFSREPGNVF